MKIYLFKYNLSLTLLLINTTMSYIVKTIKGIEYNISIVPNETVGDFKERILVDVKLKENANAQKEQIIIISRGKILKDEELMSMCDPKSIVLNVLNRVPKVLEKKEKEEIKKSNVEENNTLTPITTLSSTISSTSIPSLNLPPTTRTTTEYVPNVRQTVIAGNSYNNTPRLLPNPFSSNNSQQALGYPSFGGVTMMGIAHQNDAHMANILTELFNNKEILTSVVKGMESYKKIPAEQQNSIINDLNDNVIIRNIQNILNYLIQKHNSRSSSNNNQVSSSVGGIGSTSTNTSTTFSSRNEESDEDNDEDVDQNALQNELLNSLLTSFIMNGGRILGGPSGGMGELGVNNTRPPPTEEEQNEDVANIKSIVGSTVSDEEIKNAYKQCGYDIQMTINYLFPDLN